MNKGFEFLKHTGDLKFIAHGKNLNEMFENCVLAVSSVFSRGEKIRPLKNKEISISGSDYESLLYKFIEELIYLFDAKQFVVSNAKVNLNKNNINAILYGDSTLNYKSLDAIKSPTYAEMYVKQKDKIWECQVVLDV
ncbi:MAG: archease [Nanoarchaeota archaeon]